MGLIKVPKDLLERIVGEDPWTYSYEGLDDSCHFCGTYYITEHDKNCPWVVGRLFLGKSLTITDQWGTEKAHACKINDLR